MRSGSGLSKRSRRRGRKSTKTMCFWIKIMSPYSPKIMNLYSPRIRIPCPHWTRNLLMMSPIPRMNHSSLSTLCLNMNRLTFRTMSLSCLSIARSTINCSRLMRPMRKPRARPGPMRSSTNSFSPSNRWPTFKTPGVRAALFVNSLSHSSKLKLMMNHNRIYSNLVFLSPRRTEIPKKISISKNIMTYLLRAMNKLTIIICQM